MNRFFNLLSLVALAVAAPALAGPHGVDPHALPDVVAAKSDATSYFNHPGVEIQDSDTGGHIATVVTRGQIANRLMYGESATVKVEVTDPFGYYDAAGSEQAPKEILGNVASLRVTSGQYFLTIMSQGSNFQLARVGDRTYRGEVTVTSTTGQGGDVKAQLADTRVSFAGEKGWNSRGGKNYAVPTTK
jgi:hypothetical protein